MSPFVATVVLTLSAVGWWLLFLKAYRAKDHLSSAALAWVAIVFALWTTLSLLHVQASELWQRTLILRGILFLALTSPSAWWVLTLRVAQPTWLRRWHLLAFATPAVGGAVGQFLWPTGGPFIRSIELHAIDGRLGLEWQMGPAMLWVAVPYSYLLLLAAMLMMLYLGAGTARIERSTAFALVIAMVVPLASTIVQLTGLNPLPTYELTGLLMTPVVLMLHVITTRSSAFSDQRVAYEAVFDAIAEPAIIVRSDSTIVDANPAACALLNGGESMRGEALFSLAPQLEAARRRQRRNGDRTLLQGDLHGIEVGISHLQGRGQRVESSVLILRDLRDRLARERALHEAVQRDPLTGIANRLGFEGALKRALDELGGEALGIAFVDLDGFKPINDVYGHAAGDAVLVEVAQRLQGLVRAGDLAGRLGGDEFGLLLHRTTPLELNAVAERVQEALSAPIYYADNRLVIGASLGLASAPRDGTTIDALVRRADERMYRHKAKRTATREAASQPHPTRPGFGTA